MPFTTETFLAIFRRYNQAIWPFQWVLYALAIVAVVAAVRGGRSSSRTASAILAALWVWVGAAFFFPQANPVSTIYGLVFIAEGFLIAWMGVARPKIEFVVRLDTAGVAGSLLIAYGLVLYPLLGYAVGHRYPDAPTFGVPCPTTIFTFGLLLWSGLPRARALFAIPALWAVLGISAAIQFGMLEDIGLVVAAAAALIIVLRDQPPHWIWRRRVVANGQAGHW